MGKSFKDDYTFGQYYVLVLAVSFAVQLRSQIVAHLLFLCWHVEERAAESARMTARYENRVPVSVYCLHSLSLSTKNCEAFMETAP